MTTDASPARLKRFLAARLDPKVYLGLHVTVSLVLCALAAWAFGAILDAVLDNDTIVRWDIAAAAAIHARVTPFGLRVFEVITNIGSPVAVSVVVLAMAIWCWRRQERVLAVGVVLICAGEGILDGVLKAVVHRTRPEFAVRFLHSQSYSFPSGHSFGSIVAYGMLAFLIVDFYRPVARMRRLVWIVAAGLIILIGVSRTYLGVHYPSDVVGGWSAGIAWLAICLTGLRFARARSGHGAAQSPISA